MAENKRPENEDLYSAAKQYFSKNLGRLVREGGGKYFVYDGNPGIVNCLEEVETFFQESKKDEIFFRKIPTKAEYKSLKKSEAVEKRRGTTYLAIYDLSQRAI